MRILILTLFLALSACASTDLYQVAHDCGQATLIPVLNDDGSVKIVNGKAKMLPDPSKCRAEWGAFNKDFEEKQKRIEAREALEASKKCPAGYVYYCGHWSCHGRNPRKGYCISDYEARQIFRNTGRY